MFMHTCFQNFRKRNKKMTGFTFLFAEKRNQGKKLSHTKNRTTVVIIACLPKIHKTKIIASKNSTNHKKSKTLPAIKIANFETT